MLGEKREKQTFRSNVSWLFGHLSLSLLPRHAQISSFPMKHSSITSMRRRMHLGLLIAIILELAAFRALAAPSQLSDMDLSKSFGTRSDWRFTALQGEPVINPNQPPGTVPGKIELCLHTTDTRTCDQELHQSLSDRSPNDIYSEPHYLEKVDLVLPPGAHGRPLLLVQTGSLYSGDGDQSRLTQLLAYRPEADSFVRVYAHLTGKNNNQEVRYIDRGRLKGAIVSVDPTDDAPFGFWMVLNTYVSGSGYRQVLRYRSATTYGDGNPLPVIDSEMPNIERRLGFWRPRDHPPLPDAPCPKPHLIRMELWCGAS